MSLDRNRKKYLVEQLSPYYEANEISKRFPIEEHSVRYYANRYGIPTYHQSKKERKAQAERAMERQFNIERELTLTRVKEELSIM